MSDLDNEELKATRLLKNLEKEELDEMIKSTEKSIEETCKFLKDNSFIEYKEKSADEMFEELEYEKYDNHPSEEKIEPNKWTTQDCRVIEYTQKATIKGIFYTLFIRFHIEGKRVEIGASERREGYKEMMRYRNPILNVQELKAINKKCEELRMVEIIYVICLSLVGTYFYLYVHYKKDIYGILFTLFLCIAFVLKGVV